MLQTQEAIEEDADPFAPFRREESGIQCDGCESKDAMDCSLPLMEFGDEPIRYCPDCAAKNGFCPGCGYFIAGSRSGEATGLCETCYADNCDDDEYDDDGGYYSFYDPY